MFEREAKKTIIEVSKAFRVLLVTGPRQVGKTTLLKSLKPEEMNYVTLDDKNMREMAKREPKLFLEENPWPLFIDEAQYAPELFPYIKMKVDEENQPSMYWLTGSQQFKLMKGAKESLAGRIGIVNLNSFTYTEINKSVENKQLFNPSKFIPTEEISVNEIFDVIFNGGMPELYNNEFMKKNMFFENYVETYLSRDVKELINVSNIETFKRFMITVASRNSEQLNYTNIANDVGISDKTAASWLNVLVSSGIIYLLTPYKSTKEKRVNHMPKIIWMDSGLCSYLAGYNDPRELQSSSSSGHYLESFIISEIIKSYRSAGITPNISYFRNKKKNEIDLVFYENDKLYPFEIKKTAEPTINMLNNFESLNDCKKEVMPGGIICFYNKLMHIDKKNYILPISSVINIIEK